MWRARVEDEGREGRVVATYWSAGKPDRRSWSGGLSGGIGAQHFYHYAGTWSTTRGGGRKTEVLLKLTCMQNNDIGEGGAVALARALEYNSSITTLCLEVCGRRKKRKGT